MLNYISAEFYKILRRKYPYVTLAVMAALAALLAGGFIFTNAHGNDIDFAGGGGMAVMMLSIGLYAAILVGDMVFSDQYKFNTLKNEVSFGLHRARIYLGKLAVEAVVGVVLSLLLVVFYEGLCYLTLIPSSPEGVRATLEMVGYCVLAAMPQWLGMLALTNMFFFLVPGSTLAAFLTLGVIVVPPTAMELTALLTMKSIPGLARALMNLKGCMPQSMVEGAGAVVGDWAYIARSWLTGGLWIAGCTAIGLTGFSRREIS